MAAGAVTISGAYTINMTAQMISDAALVPNLNTGGIVVLPDANTGQFKLMFIEGA